MNYATCQVGIKNKYTHRRLERLKLNQSRYNKKYIYILINTFGICSWDVCDLSSWWWVPGGGGVIPIFTNIKDAKHINSN